MVAIVWKGQQIGTAGMYRDVPLEKYHGAGICAGPSVSSTGLRKIVNQSPAHYFDGSPYNPKPETDAEERNGRS
jgi:hypothetical protein